MCAYVCMCYVCVCVVYIGHDEAARDGKSAASAAAAMWRNCVLSRCGRYIHVLFRFCYIYIVVLNFPSC